MAFCAGFFEDVEPLLCFQMAQYPVFELLAHMIGRYTISLLIALLLLVIDFLCNTILCAVLHHARRIQLHQTKQRLL